MSRKRKKLHGTVIKVIKPTYSSQKEKAEIEIREADQLYREIRVENELTDDLGARSVLKPGADVEIVIEADSNATLRKPELT